MGSHFETPLLQIKPYSDHHPFQYGPFPTDNDLLRIIPLEVRKEPARKRPKYTRSKLGCLTCRAKKVKCDEVKPKCTRCTQGHRECTWPESGAAPRKRSGVVKKEDGPSPSNSEPRSSSSSSPMTCEPSPRDRKNSVHLPQLPSFEPERRSSIHSDYSHPSPALLYETQPPSHLTMDSVEDTHHNYSQTNSFGSHHTSHHSSTHIVPQSTPVHSSYFYPPGDLPSHNSGLGFTRSYENLPPMDITRLPPSYYLPSSHYPPSLHYGSQNPGESYHRPPALQWPLLNQDLPYPSPVISRHRQEFNDARYNRPPVGAW